jgi:outer membrane receptor protein involved in Fe transport
VNAAADGQFQFPVLPIGKYRLSVMQSGKVVFSTEVEVHLGGVSSYQIDLNGPDELSPVVVRQVSSELDFAATTTGRTFDLPDLNARLPMARNIANVALLAPTVALGSSGQNGDFASQSSIGGASIAENAFYINGMNITDFDRYIGGANIPFDFYQTIDVKTGGYPAEFGRADGGMIIAVAKSGTNTPTLGLHLNWAPENLRSHTPDTNFTASRLGRVNTADESIEGGGAIIPDRLFFYGLYDFRQTHTKGASIPGRAYSSSTSDNPIWAAKFDGYLTSRHHLELTLFDNNGVGKTRTRSFDNATSTISGLYQPTRRQEGGVSYVARYTATLSDQITVSTAYGRMSNHNAAQPYNPQSPYVTDSRDPENIQVISSQKSTGMEIVNTERSFVRADLDLLFRAFGKHHVRLGYDREETRLEHDAANTGQAAGSLPTGSVFNYFLASDQNVLGLAQGTPYVAISHYLAGGRFNGVNEAFYLQDSWDLTPRLNLQLGVRNDLFHLNGADDQRYAAFNANWAPRLGFSYKLAPDGGQKLFGAYGRYFLPISSNLAYRGASATTQFDEYWLYSGAPNANGAPSLTTLISGFPIQTSTGCVAGGYAPVGAMGCVVSADGKVPPAQGFQAHNTHATYEDEVILGYEAKLAHDWRASAVFTWRSLGRVVEDAAIDAGVLAYCTAHNIAGCDQIWGGFTQYSYINPGHGVTVSLAYPLPGETALRTINFTAADLNLPKAKRDYTALALSLSHPFTDGWSLDLTYTLSRSYGNYEGAVNSTFGQTDTSITQDFDQPGLEAGAKGLLPNHHLHEFKAFGAYQLTPSVSVGGNLIVQSPKHFGCIGNNPTDMFAAAYGAASWYCGGVLTPRGSQFTADWQVQFDASARYRLPGKWAKNAVARVDVFNLFDQQAKLDFDEFGDLSTGGPNPNYRQILAYQAPRYVRLGLDVSW